MNKIINRVFNPTTALVVGVLVLLSGATPNQSQNFVTGFIIIISTLAYRSAKKRIASGVKNNTKFAFEIIAMIAIILVIGLQNNLGKVLIEDPFPNFIIPLILVGSYIYILRKKQIYENNRKLVTHYLFRSSYFCLQTNRDCLIRISTTVGRKQRSNTYFEKDF